MDLQWEGQGIGHIWCDGQCDLAESPFSLALCLIGVWASRYLTPSYLESLCCLHERPRGGDPPELLGLDTGLQTRDHLGHTIAVKPGYETTQSAGTMTDGQGHAPSDWGGYSPSDLTDSWLVGMLAQCGQITWVLIKSQTSTFFLK